MYFRVTTYGFDAARFDEFLAMADTFRDELNAIDGLESVHSCVCLLYTSPSPRDATLSRMPSSA